MPRGPLPNPNRRRTNQPTIPTTRLPREGRTGPAPDCPYDLGKAGKAWWVWAWGTPQATAWDDGALYAVARRASLEDDLEALAAGDFDLAKLLERDEDEMVAAIERAMRKLKAMAGGRSTVMREMRELDNRFGLNPKGMADLRWSIEDAEPAAAPVRSERALRAV